MKKSLLFLFIGWGLILSGCYRSSTAVWEDTKTVGRRLHRKARLLWRKDVDSRMIESSEDFTAPQGEEYIPYEDDDITTLQTEYVIPAAKHEPGALGSSIPSIEGFSLPTGSYASIFQMLHFATDSDLLGACEKQIIQQIASYMHQHRELYLFVEGHCDQRASKTYNLALGTRRAQSVRTALVKQGIDPNRIFTISYGKELPLDPSETPAAWAKNRRASFKIFNQAN